MRHNIWEKDDFFGTPQRRIEMDPAVVELPTEPIPLFWSYDRNNLCGYVTDIRLEDGAISCEVVEDKEKVYNLETMLKNVCRLGGFYNDVHYTVGTRTRVSKCRLEAVSIVLNTHMPGGEKTK